jgi:chromosome segregation protein
VRASAQEIAERVAAMESDRAALEEKAEEAARGFLALEEERKTALERKMEVRLAAAEARGRADGARSRAERATEEGRSLEDRALALEAEAADLDLRAASAAAEIAEAEAVARRRDADRGAGGDALVAAKAHLADLEVASGADHQKQATIQRLYEEARRELESYRLKDGEFRVRIESLVEQVRQDQGLDLPKVASEEPPTESLVPEEIEAEVEELRRKMEDLGNVNLNAIGELDEAEKHVEFLRAQEKDLLDGKTSLEQAITELDTLSTTRFAETFEKVREHFRETFRRLFGGGRAEIVLEDASNVLESGIDIIARPPGKEQRSISLLSGGERTLTAVALLFAVFQAKPSPFAILDEVDAALDEANVRRLIALVREFTDRSQFLVVTHAKTTMEAADVLYGVTMEEAGVSKKVAVRLTEFSAAVAAG